MKKHIQTIVLFSILTVTASAYSSCNSATTSSNAKYHCPMECNNDSTYTGPGKCATCEMDLEVRK